MCSKNFGKQWVMLNMTQNCDQNVYGNKQEAKFLLKYYYVDLILEIYFKNNKRRNNRDAPMKHESMQFKNNSFKFDNYLIEWKN